MTNLLKPSTTPPDPTAPSWMKRVALLTGVLAALAGFLTVRGTNLSNEAIYHSNQAVLFQALASDAWAEFQAASVKSRVVETALITRPAPVTDVEKESEQKLKAQIQELRDRQPPLRDKAKEMEQKRDAELQVGGTRLKEKDLLAYAGMSVQLGIALASVAALTRRRDAFIVAICLGIAGAAITAYAIVGHHLAHV